MTRKQSLVFFALAFAVDSVMNFLKEPATVMKEFGATTVFLGGVAEALGHIVLPAIIITIWALIALARKKSLPENFVKNAALLLAAFAILGMLSGIAIEFSK